MNAPTPQPRPEDEAHSPLLVVDHLTLHFPVKKGVVLDRVVAQVRAVDDVSFTLQAQETLGVVGESGCGKSTLANCLLHLLPPTSGSVSFRGQDVTLMKRASVKDFRRQVQMVFQDPQSSLNPRKRVAQIISTGLDLRGVDRSKTGEEVRRLLQQVGLRPEHANRFPHEFSGGQRQRVGIARAISVRPSLVVLDEPVSALDVSVQAQVINLLSDLQRQYRLAFIYIAHNLAVVRHVSDRIAVMYLGKIVELSPADELYRKPLHPYTAALLSAIPVPDLKARGTRRVVAKGELPSALRPPPGCRFHPRCPRASEVCRTSEPPLTEFADNHLVACHHPLNLEPADLSVARRSPLSPLSAGDETPTVVDFEEPLATGKES
ncbi:MAG: oligopeptide/dipeptide ABC transporter ATP-binding protein [Acidimicrobiales bacterium]